MSAENFEQAAKDMKNLSKKPTDAELLELYSLYKQATVGDCNTDRPGMFDLAGKAKWDAWNSKKEMAKEDAQTKYVTKANELKQIYGMK